jgi:site-specific DNA-methyltransferase (adenine-specific)
MECVQIGTAKLYRGDCLEAMRLMPDNAFDLAIVDPPYGIGEGRGQHKSRNRSRPDHRTGKRHTVAHKTHAAKKWDDKPPPPEYFTQLRRVSKNQIIWGGNYFLGHLPATPCMIVWDKVNGESDFADCELAWASFGTAARIFRYMWAGFLQGKSISQGHVNQGDKRLCEERIHPTQKPVNLYKWLLINYAKSGDHILDTHHGSGSNAIACLDMGFSITAYELDEDYFKAAVERIHLSQQQMKLVL